MKMADLKNDIIDPKLVPQRTLRGGGKMPV